ncbi:succinylglutamate desuccinylase/aspartoacylase family protein [Gilvibacter sp.]|uniref:succinylglutamate desuccinylase/aspartoacylase family protein n=1 Tax=Gilvibacter sp. TaxID=2729997 RepID=UPI003F4A3FED
MAKNQAKFLELCGEEIAPGASVEINLNTATLHTQTKIDVPIIIERAKKDGPTVLFTAGIHGDEVNGIEVVRQLIAKGINKPKIGTIVCIPIVNIFGFIQKSREFPDGRDLNRVFPGSRSGSLASQFAYQLTKQIMPHIDYCMDFHTGGSSRFNVPHIRITGQNKRQNQLAEIFNAPFILHSKNIKKSFRSYCEKNDITALLFEGGKSNSIDNVVSNTGVNGAKRVLNELGMLRSRFKVSSPKNKSVVITQSRWLRASTSGMFKPSVKAGEHVPVGHVLGHITDPYGKVHYWIRSNTAGYVINVNEAPIVYQGDALFHISTENQ